MRVRFLFGESTVDAPVTIPSTAYLLAQLQVLWLFVIYLSLDESEYRDTQTHPYDLEYLERALTTDAPERLFWYFAEPPYWGVFGEPPFALRVDRIQYASPLQVDTTSDVLTPHHASRLSRVVDAIKKLIALDHVREEAFWRAQVTKQHALKLALANFKEALQIEKKITDPALREEFNRNLVKPLAALTDERAPVKLADIQILGPPTR